MGTGEGTLAEDETAYGTPYPFTYREPSGTTFPAARRVPGQRSAGVVSGEKSVPVAERCSGELRSITGPLGVITGGIWVMASAAGGQALFGHA